MFLISRKAIRFILYIIIIDLHSTRAANNFSFLKGHMSDQVSILVGQNRNVVGRFLFLIIIFKGKSFLKKIISYHYLLIIWLKNLSGHNVRPKLRFRRTWADDRRLFAALQYYFFFQIRTLLYFFLFCFASEFLQR